MKKIIQGIRVSIFFICLALAGKGQSPEQDCFSAITVCSTTYTQQNSYNGVGSVQEIPSGNSCLLNGESNSVWYVFTVSSSGQLTFQVSPLIPNIDYDWVLYDLTDSSCASIVNGNVLPVRCNYSSTTGSTGLSAGFTNTTSPSSGPNQSSPINVITGETYALLVNNFTGSSAGYNLNFAGSSSITDASPPQLDSLNNTGVCNPLFIYVFFDEPIRCSSIASNGSDFSISGPAAHSVIAALPIACIDGFTNQVRIRLNTKIMVTGNYTISMQTGTDGNSVLDFCGANSANGENIVLPVQLIGPSLSIAGITHSSCGINDGAIDLEVTGGSAPYTYDWPNPLPDIQDPANLSPGLYEGAVTDANGCVERIFVTISDNNAPSLSLISVSGISCSGLNDGSATVAANGGTPPYTYTWNSSPPQTGATATGLPAGSVTALVTDASGCSNTLFVTIPGISALNVQFTIAEATCGLANGSATALVTGGAGNYVYTWSTGGNTNTATGLAAGVYQFNVTDANGCSYQQDVIITNANAPAAFIQSSIPSCGAPTGSGTVAVSGGLPPFTYVWNTNPPQTGPTATNLTPGNYYVTITDSVGCIQIINMKLDSMPPPVLQLVNTTPVTCGNADGTALVNAQSGSPSYSYSWNTAPPQAGAQATGLGPGIYDVIVTDNIGCTDTLQVSIVYGQAISSIQTQTKCVGEPVQFISLSNTNADSWYWDFGDPSSGIQNTDTIQNPVHTYLTGGNHLVTLHLNGPCIPDTVVHLITVNPLPVASFVTSPQLLSTQTSVSFFYTGTNVVSYYWDFGNGGSSVLMNPLYNYTDSGNYTVTLIVMDVNGCSDTLVVSIHVIKDPAIYVPNAFTPSGNTVNSHFRIAGEGVSAVEFRIYSRWGDLLYQTNNVDEAMNIGWDGKYRGKPVPQDVYTYFVEVDFITGKKFSKSGTVTLIR